MTINFDPPAIVNLRKANTQAAASAFGSQCQSSSPCSECRALSGPPMFWRSSSSSLSGMDGLDVPAPMLIKQLLFPARNLPAASLALLPSRLLASQTAAMGLG